MEETPRGWRRTLDDMSCGNSSSHIDVPETSVNTSEFWNRFSASMREMHWVEATECVCCNCTRVFKMLQLFSEGAHHHQSTRTRAAARRCNCEREHEFTHRAPSREVQCGVQVMGRGGGGGVARSLDDMTLNPNEFESNAPEFPCVTTACTTGTLLRAK
jgi:hypothetical protein